MKRTQAILAGCLILAFSGCKKKSSAEHQAPSGLQPSASAAKPAAPAAAMGGTITVKSDFLGSHDAKIGDAHAFISGTKDHPRVELSLFNANLKNMKDCDAEITEGGASIGENQFSLTLDGELDHMPTASSPGTAKDVNYTAYYRPKGQKEGTNSGDHRDSTMVITRLDDHVVKGTYHQGKEITADFVAKVCSNKLADEGSQ